MRQPLGELENSNKNSQEDSTTEQKTEKETVSEVVVEDAESVHWKVGDKLDCRDEECGSWAWTEAIVKRITKNDENAGADLLTYHIKYEHEGEEWQGEGKRVFKVCSRISVFQN